MPYQKKFNWNTKRANTKIWKMERTKKLLTPAQKGRLQRDQQILVEYGAIQQKAPETAMVQTYQEIANKMLISPTTVRRVVEEAKERGELE